MGELKEEQTWAGLLFFFLIYESHCNFVACENASFIQIFTCDEFLLRTNTWSGNRFAHLPQNIDV